jgi:hypothetical protein
MDDDAYKNRTNWRKIKITARQSAFNYLFDMKKQESQEKYKQMGITIETSETRHIFWLKSVQIVPHRTVSFTRKFHICIPARNSKLTSKGQRD